MNQLNFQVGIKILYQLISVNPQTGKETPLTGKFGNTILTSGRNEMAKQDWFTAVQVGTDNTVPVAGHTALLGFKAGTSTIEEDQSGAQGITPYYGWRRKRFRFAVGTTDAILSEIAIGWSAASGSNIATRALIVDTDGNPTTVTPLVDEILDAVIEIRYYPPLGNSTGTVVFDGVTYDYIIKACQVTSPNAWGIHCGDKIQVFGNFVTDWASYNDDLGTLEQTPSGVVINADTAEGYTSAYSENSYQIAFGKFIGPGGWNQLTGKLLRSVRCCTTGGYYQVQFDSQSSPGNGIPKIDSKNINIQCILGWTEQIIP